MWRALLTLLTLASAMGASPWTFRAGSTTNAPALDAILATFAGASNNLGTATLDITPVAVYGTNRLLVVVVKANDNGSGNQPASVIWDPLGVNEGAAGVDPALVRSLVCRTIEPVRLQALAGPLVFRLFSCGDRGFDQVGEVSVRFHE